MLNFSSFEQVSILNLSYFLLSFSSCSTYVAIVFEYSQARLHSRIYLRKICCGQELLKTLANCTSANFASIYAKFTQVLQAQMESHFARKEIWLQSVVSKNTRMHTGG